MMNGSSRWLMPLAVLGFGSTLVAAPFTPGNLVVLRVGDGAGAVANNVANPVFLEEFTTGGSTAGNSIAMPTAPSGGNFTLTMSRSSTSQGQLSLSGDGRYLSMLGFDQPVGTTGGSSNAAFRGRTVGLVDLNGNVLSSTRYEAPAALPRAAYTPNGVDIYTAQDGGNGSPLSGGLRYMTFGQTDGGTILNGTTANIRVVNGYNGQLYASASTGIGGDYRGVFSVGAGFPTTAGQTYTLLPGFGRLGGGVDNGNTESTYDFFFASASTLYVTDDDTSAPASGGLQKWSFNGSTWTKLWTITPIARSITGAVDDQGNVSLYLITGDGTTLSSVSDTLAGIAAPSGFTTLATAPANTVFRGVEFSPIPEPTGLAVILAGAGLLISRRRLRS